VYTNHIIEYKKLIPSHVCKKIIHIYDDIIEEDSKIIIADTKKNIGYNDKEIRNCTRRDLKKHSNTFGKKICLNYITNKLKEVDQKFKEKFPYANTKIINQIDLLKYEANEYDAGYKYHSDTGPACMNRTLSISICLNNDFVGGDFRFWVDNKEHIYPQNEGDCIVFPSNFMFPHQVDTVTKGTRYAIIAWTE